MKNIKLLYSYFIVALLTTIPLPTLAQVGINTVSPTKQLDVNVTGLGSDGINISNTDFSAQILTEPVSGAGTMVINNSAINGQTSIRFNNNDRMTFTNNGLFPRTDASDNVVTGALDLGRFDLHYRRVYTRGIHTFDNDVNGGLRIAIGSGGGTTPDYNFSNFAFYPVASQQKDLGRNGNFWRNFYFVSAFTPSDKRLKKNIAPLDLGLKTINAMKVYSYNYTFESEPKLHYGFMAQELQKILPELVSIGDDEEKSLSINYTETIPILIKAVQEQQALIDNQGKELKELKELVEELISK